MNAPVERQLLANRLAKDHADFSEALLDDDTTIEEIRSPLLHTRIFVAEQFRPTRPLLLLLGQHETGATFVLNERPDEFNRMTATDGSSVDSIDAAIARAALYLRAVRLEDERYQVVSTTDEMPWLVGGDNAERVSGAKQQVAGWLHAPASRRHDDGFDVVFTVVHNRNLEEVTVHLSLAGQASSSSRTLASALPLAYVEGGG